MKRIALLPAGILLFIACFLPLAAASVELDGLPVTGITLKDDVSRPLPDLSYLLTLIEVRPGDPFSRQMVRKGIGYLYLTGKFRDIRVEAFPDQAGVRLEYTLVPVIIVEKVVLRGNHSLPDRVIRNAVRGVEGKELREENFSDILAEIQTRYQAEGFYNTRVTFRHEPAADPNRVVLFLYITEPKQTIIKKIAFKGTKVFTDQELLSSMKNRPGRPLLTNVLFEDDMEALRRKYTEAGYPAAVAGPVSMSFRDERAFLEITVDEGPKVTLSFSGTDAFCAENFPDLFDHGPDNDQPFTVQWEECAAYFRDLLLIGTEHDVSDTVIESSVEKIRKVYLDEGYMDVKVEVRKTGAGGRLEIAFMIQEGQKVAVDKISAEGNTFFTTKQIKDMMATRESGWFRSRPYREDILDKDVDLITDQYVAAGFPSAEIRRTVTRTAGGVRALITLKITEGRRTLTGNISFEGNVALGSEELAKVLQMRSAAPFNERLLEEDRYRILSLYSARGYLYASVEAEKKSAVESEPAGKDGAGGVTDNIPEVLNVRYRITEDLRVFIGKVILRGNVATRDSVILRELEPRTGEPYNYESMLKSQQRVYRYGYFSLAKFEPVHPNEKEHVKDMLFTVEERPAGAVEFGVGYGTLDRLRGFVELSHRNILGTTRFASMRFEASDILERAAFTLREPWYLGYRNLESKFLLVWSNAKRINEQTREIYYETRKTAASYGVEKTYDALKTSLTYQYEIVTNYNVQQAAELTPEDSGHVLISSLNPAVVWDLRDNPFNPTRGSVHGANLKQAMDLLGSKASFTKATVQTSWFVPVAERKILALSARAGMAWPHKDTAEIPINERFYLGGGTTVRGYIQDSIGPPSDEAATSSKVPTGGDGMVQLNAELRLNNAEGSGIVFFADAGNVWVQQAIHLNDLRASYGTGLRYNTPVGPIRVDYGQKIHRRPGESPGQLHFSIGQAF
jgi:outer membrane protein insertion porin family